MAVPTRITDFSTTAASNFPAGTEAVGTSLDDYLRAYQAVVALDLSSKGADIASASTTDLGAVGGLSHDITGTTTITSFGTVRAGVMKIIKFEGALTLTHNATSLILPSGANITTADGDVAVVVSEGSGNWRCVGYQPAGTGVYGGPVQGTSQASTSGTTIDFTSIPSWVKKITITLIGLSTNGTSALAVQIGDAGGIESASYASTGFLISTSPSVSVATSTDRFLISGTLVAASTYTGTAVLTLADTSNTWVCVASLTRDDGQVHGGSGSKATSATLDRVRITTVNGTDAFDAGAINILYE